MHTTHISTQEPLSSKGLQNAQRHTKTLKKAHPYSVMLSIIIYEYSLLSICYFNIFFFQSSFLSFDRMEGHGAERRGEAPGAAPGGRGAARQPPGGRDDHLKQKDFDRSRQEGYIQIEEYII